MHTSLHGGTICATLIITSVWCKLREHNNNNNNNSKDHQSDRSFLEALLQSTQRSQTGFDVVGLLVALQLGWGRGKLAFMPWWF